MASLEFNVGFLDNQRDELGYKIKDLAVPVQINKNNYDIKDRRDLESIKEGLSNIFHWMRGERILNPLFGNPIIDYIGEPINPETAKKIGSSLNSAINTWEPRIVIRSMDVVPNEDLNQYNITVYYDVPVLNLYNLDYNKLVTIEE